LGVALGVASKYPGAIATIMVAAVITAVAVRDHSIARWLRHGMLAAACFIGMLFVISPNLFTNASAVVTSFRRESRATHPGADGLNFVEKLHFYTMSYVELSGLLLALLTVLGVVIAVRR